MKKWSLQYCSNGKNEEVANYEAATKQEAINEFNGRFSKTINLNDDGYFNCLGMTWVVAEYFNPINS
jgi:hypothetical protein